MANVKNNAAAQETQRRLMEAAGQVFAEKGLHAATIKEITDRAGVNMAAVNYHFSDKFELYAAVVRYALTLSKATSPAEELTGTPEDRLRQETRHRVEELFDPDLPAWRGPLLAHEFVQPTAAMDSVKDELLRPYLDVVRGVVRDIVGPGVSEKRVLAAAFSVIAQSLFYLYHTTLIQRLHPDLVGQYSPKELADHIVEFSLPGLHAMRTKRQARPKRRVRTPA